MKRSIAIALLGALIASPLAAADLRVTRPSSKRVTVRVYERVQMLPYCVGRAWYAVPAVPLLWCVPRPAMVPTTLEELNAARATGHYRGPYPEITRFH